MKRIVAIILAVLMVTALLAACGDNNDPVRTVKTVVNPKYDDGFAKSYASSTSTDSNGNTTYEFSGEKYDSFVYDYKNSVADSIAKEVVKNHDSSFGQFTYIDTEKNAVIIGLNPGEYEAGYAEAEAPAYAAEAFKVFQNLETPVSTISVIYCNANNQDEIYGTFEITAS